MIGMGKFDYTGLPNREDIKVWATKLVNDEFEKIEAADPLTVICPTCEKLPKQRCIVFVHTNISVDCSGLGAAMEMHPHRERVLAAIKANIGV